MGSIQMKFMKTIKNNLKHSFKKIYHAPNLSKVNVPTSQKKNFTEEEQREAIHKSSIDQTQDINFVCITLTFYNFISTIICGKLLSLLGKKYLIEISGFSLVHSMILKILQ